jgi:hypothetical protein
VFNAVLDGRPSRHQARLGWVFTADGPRIAAQIAVGRDSKGQVQFKVYLLNTKFTPASTGCLSEFSTPSLLPKISAAASQELSQMAARGEIKVTGDSADLTSLQPTANRKTQLHLNALQKQQWEAMWLLIDAGLLYTAFGRLGAAVKTVRAFEAGTNVAGKAVTQAQYKAAQGYLVSAMVGGAAGQGSYWIFIERKYYVEAIDALQKGKPFEALSYGAKAAIQFLTWSVGTASMGAEVAANVNIKWGKELAVNRLGSPKNWLDAVNWGMFVDPTLYTAVNFRRDMGPGAQALVSKYNVVLDFIERNPGCVLNGQKLAIPDDIIKAANIPGVTDNASLAKSFITDGAWRVFNATPIPFTPSLFASTSTARGTISATTQLIVTRAVISGAANVVFQNLNSLAMNGTIGVNWVQMLASITGGATRSVGAPAAWLAPTIKGRLMAYGGPSLAAFIEGIALKGYFQTRKANHPKEFKADQATYSAKQLQIMSNANQAANSSALLFEALTKSGFATQANLDLVGEYFAKVTALLAGGADKLVAQAAALDKWLDGTAPGTQISRRSALNSFQLGLVPGLERQVENAINAGTIRTQVGTRTFADIGIAPKFSEFISTEKL